MIQYKLEDNVGTEVHNLVVFVQIRTTIVQIDRCSQAYYIYFQTQQTIILA